MIELNEELRRRFSDYTNAVFAPEDDVLAELARRTAAAGLGAMQITAEVGRLLQVLALAIGARRILEVGTLFGYSTIWLARALPPGGRLLTLEADAGRALEAREWIGRARLEDSVEVRVGPALEILPGLPAAEPFDFAFIDAAKAEYPAYLDEALRLVRPGGLITADNVLFASSTEGTVLDESSGVPRIDAVREFNRRIAGDPRLASILVPVREGVSISFVRG